MTTRWCSTPLSATCGKSTSVIIASLKSTPARRRWSISSRRRLLPPEYPGSQLVNVEQERHPNTRTEQRTYHTPDDMETVLAYMEQYLPGFTQASGERYENQIEDTGWPSRIVAASGPLNLLESGLPGAAVELDDTDDGGTEITFTAYWPDP